MHKKDLNQNPIEQFVKWYEDALVSETMPDAMTLATVGVGGKPSARIVLYKGIDQGGFLVFTNYSSRKGKELLENPQAALVFFWPTLYRQIRIEGEMEKITHEESQRYFDTRPYESKISAWVSEQSTVIPNREYLLERYIDGQEKFSAGEVTCPEFWGGFRLIPTSLEFWAGGEHRLHDRFLYTRNEHVWKIERLAP